MKKLIVLMILSLFITTTLTSCGEPAQILVNVDNVENRHSNKIGKFILISTMESGDSLCYDEMTRIVYSIWEHIHSNNR